MMKWTAYFVKWFKATTEKNDVKDGIENATGMECPLCFTSLQYDSYDINL